MVYWGQKMSTETPLTDNHKDPSPFPEGLPESKVRNYLPVTETGIVESFLDPVRRAILVTLRTGTASIKKESREDTIEREDGTKITTTVVEERNVKRFWMSVPEIVKYIEDFIPEIEVSKYNCYYHLPKLRDQGLIEQHPEPECDDEGNEVSSKRGVYYRRTAKVFIVSSAKMSGETVELYLKLFEHGVINNPVAHPLCFLYLSGKPA